MKTYETKLIIQKAGKKPARLGFLDVTAASEQEALDIAAAEGNRCLANARSLTGKHDNTTRVWAELV